VEDGRCGAAGGGEGREEEQIAGGPEIRQGRRWRQVATEIVAGGGYAADLTA